MWRRMKHMCGDGCVETYEAHVWRRMKCMSEGLVLRLGIARGPSLTRNRGHVQLASRRSHTQMHTCARTRAPAHMQQHAQPCVHSQSFWLYEWSDPSPSCPYWGLPAAMAEPSAIHTVKSVPADTAVAPATSALDGIRCRSVCATKEDEQSGSALMSGGTKGREVACRSVCATRTSDRSGSALMSGGDKATGGCVHVCMCYTEKRSIREYPISGGNEGREVMCLCA